MKRIIYTAVIAGIMCVFLASCNSSNNMKETGYDAAGSDAADSDTSGYEPIEWKDDPTIGKVQAGCYKRNGITKDGETYEEMLKLRDIENKGYLIVYDDGTAIFDLDGEITEYAYDEFNFYLSEDTERTNGIPYVFIGGRIVVDDGSTITQYLKLTDEEYKAYMEK